MTRPTFAYLPDAYDQPPETDPAPVECPECGRTEECDCGGNDEWDEGNVLPEERKADRG